MSQIREWILQKLKAPKERLLKTNKQTKTSNAVERSPKIFKKLE
jgi:hypothetical protein